MTEEEMLKRIDSKLSAIIILLSDRREEDLQKMDNGSAKTEVLLKRAGLSPSEIAELLDKKVAAVQKTIQRGKK